MKTIRLIGYLKRKFLSFRAYDVHDAKANVLSILKGKFFRFSYRFKAGDVEYAHVTNEWMGTGKSANGYLVEITEAAPKGHPLRQLIIGAIMCIDVLMAGYLDE